MDQKTCFSVVEMRLENVAFVCEMRSEMWLLCLKMRAQIRGFLGQMAHRRQIAQWSGTRTPHPGGTGFETGPPPKLGSARLRSGRGFFGS